MSRLETWIKNQSPEAAKGMTVVRDVDCLHISNNPRLGKMTPRVGQRQMRGEDRTIPRIACAESIVDCIYGHAGVREYTINKQHFDGDDWVDITSPAFTVYRLNVEEVVRPSKKLVPDAVKSRELWVVPYSPESCLVKPERVGQLVLKKTIDIHDAGERHIKNTFLLNVVKPFKLDDELLSNGYYQFELHGSLSVFKDKVIRKPENLKPIAGIDYHAQLKKMVTRK